MEEFNISSNKLQKLATLKELLQKGVEHIPELQAYLSKINSIVDTIKDGEISVVYQVVSLMERRVLLQAYQVDWKIT